MATLLAIDDDPGILTYYRAAFKGRDVTVLTAQTGGEGIAAFERLKPEVVLLDVDLPDLSGLDVFKRLRAIDAKVPVLFVTGSGTTETAIKAMSLGAYEYLLKPFDLRELLELTGRAVEVGRLMRVPAVVVADALPVPHGDALVGRCRAMQDVYKAVGRVALNDVIALVLGESGTGKELIARAIYKYSLRADGPFLAINCGAIPEPLLESELFGHEKGAFTGADRRRIGKFEQVSGGTLFLDEVGEMTPLTQTKLLRVLQDQTFERVGGTETVQTDVRIIAATNRDLEAAVAAGQFRADLYYRLNVYAIHLPPLRERGEDLPILIEHFLRRFQAELRKDVTHVSPPALELLRRHPWPGNIRELQSALKHAVLQATGPVILPEHLPPALHAAPRRPAAAPSTPEGLDAFIEERLAAGTGGLYADWLALLDRRLFAQVLRHTSGNLSHAAKLLGIHRTTLRGRLEALGLDPDAFGAGENPAE